MAITIKKVTTKKELKQFIRFNYELYKNVPYKVPELYEDMVDTLTPGKNAALEFCDYVCFMAYKDEQLAGRVVAIINHRSNEIWKKKAVRFGWIDFIDDIEVSTALLDAVSQYGRQNGMEEIEGPLGFTDMDPEGMLIDGFDQMGTMSTIYNYPYYPQHIEQLGFVKENDWVEFNIKVPESLPDKMIRISDIIKKKYNLHSVPLTKKMIKDQNYGQRIFELINEGYKNLFGFAPLTSGQIKQYVKTYLSLLNTDMISVIEDENNEIIAVGITMGSMSEALQKAKGKLFPFGWYHILKCLKFKDPKTVDMLLVAVKPEYQNKGVNSLLFTDLFPVFKRRGFTNCESNPEMETNSAVQRQWEYFETRMNKRRRCYSKKL